MTWRSDREKCAHLLRRFGLGASEAEIDFYLAGTTGIEGAIKKLIYCDEVDEVNSFSVDDLVLTPESPVNMRVVQLWWYGRILTTRKPFAQRMALFWHDHFATSASKVNQPGAMLDQVSILERKGRGSFQVLLTEICQDPAMIFWLDSQFNVKGKPNENFARELLELFTFGVDQGYSEDDIREIARAFTGWRFARNPSPYAVNGSGTFVFDPRAHDSGIKTIFGKSGDFSGEDVIEILCKHPRTAEFIVQKIWEHFVYPNPDASTIKNFSAKFQEDGLNISKLAERIALAPEFWSDRAFRCLYKSPVDFVIPTARQLGLGETAGERLRNNREAKILAQTRQVAQVFQAVRTSTTSMGMELMFPPDVAGWDQGSSWITSATMLERINWSNILFGTRPSRRTPGQPLPTFINFPIETLLPRPTTSEAIVDALVSLFDAPITPALRSSYVQAAQAGLSESSNPRNACLRVCKILFGSPEFQMC